MTFLRMSGDNEIIALRASGLGISKLLPPVIIFSLIGVILTFWMTVYGKPWGKLALKELTYQVAISNLEIGLKERTFNDNFEGVTVYVNEINSRTKTLKDVFVEDRRVKNLVSTIVAPEAVMIKGPDPLITRVRFYNGTWNQADIEKRTINSIKFGTYELKLDLVRR